MTFGVVIAVATVSWLLAWVIGWWLGHDDGED